MMETFLRGLHACAKEYKMDTTMYDDMDYDKNDIYSDDNGDGYYES